MLKFKNGKHADTNIVENALSKKHYKAICMTHVDTSTTVVNPIENLVSISKKFNVYSIVDSICGVGGIPLNFDQISADIVFTGSQKAIAAPPGAVIIAVSDKAMNYISSRNNIPTYYMNLVLWKKIMDDPGSYLAIAHRLADAAGEIIRPKFRTELNIETKADESPVTIADREAESAMRAIIEKEAPRHGIRGEELPDVTGDGEWCWYLDPIDGTNNYVNTSQHHAVSVAAMYKGYPMVGVIWVPWANDGGNGLLMHAMKGSGTWINGKRIEIKILPIRTILAFSIPRNFEVYKSDTVAGITARLII